MQPLSFDALVHQVQTGAPEFAARIADVCGSRGRLSVATAAAGCRQLLLMAGLALCPTPAVVVCPSVEMAGDLVTVLRESAPGLAEKRRLVVLPELGAEPMEYTQYSQSLAFSRARALHEIYHDPESTVFTTLQALIDPTMNAPEFVGLELTIRPGDRIAPHHLADCLLRMGYEAVTSVTEMGQFSMRGNVFDLYAQAGEYPARLVLEGDTVSRIKLFDPVSQRSVEPVTVLEILPPYPVLFDAAGRRSFAALAVEQWKKELAGKEDASPEGSTFLEDMESFLSTANSKGINYFLYQYADPESLCCGLLRFLARSASLFFMEVDPAGEAQLIFTSARDLYERAHEAGLALPTAALDNLQKAVQTMLDGLPRAVVLTVESGKNALELPSSELPPLALADSLAAYLRQHTGQRPVDVVSWNIDRAWRLFSDALHDEPALLTRPAFMKGSFTAGFTGGGITVLTDRELFPKRAVSPKRTTRFSQSISRLEDLHAGDYVVHRDYGIGIFRGMTALTVDGVTRDYISLEYKDHSLLHVPVERLGCLEKYVGDRTQIALDEPGSKKWSRARKEAAEDAKRIAHDLLETAARRYAREGFRFRPNPELEQPIADAFTYELTPDQSKAIDDVLEDMEEGRPMDRLVCGDVGFGKTEVAIRAAARAVANGKQVAVAAPTTILAMQHYRNMEARFEPVGYRVALFSRLVSPGEITKNRKLLQNGGIDVAVGTHKILNMAGSFKDIGLLIVDEEQLFGVLDKEKIKRLKAEVDVLTLSATPIPRTLESSIVGIRNISLINTPPVGRYPIRTFLMAFDEEQLQRAVQSELERHGQVYFVHNRIADIDARLSILKRLFPQARIAVAHGKLQGDVLEQVMLDFYEGRYDILLSTTIIEAGLDFPNVNTIIVDEAECLGLAQLYQLRGRVGRSQRHAYAYIFYSRGLQHDSIAYKRLEAIASAVDFGAGLQVALKDLELRGAGDVLGVKQSGRFSDVGYHMFLSMVEEQIMRERGQYVEPAPKPTVLLDVSAFIPENYIADAGQRLSLYNVIERSPLQGLPALVDQTVDRYGPLPAEMQTVFALKRIELTLTSFQVLSLQQSTRAFVLDFASPDAAARFFRTTAARVPGATLVRDSVVIPAEKGRDPVSFLSWLLSMPESVH